LAIDVTDVVVFVGVDVLVKFGLEDRVNCSKDLCSIKSWAQTLQDRDAKTVAINFEIAASTAFHGTATKVRVVISYVRYYALGWLRRNKLTLIGRAKHH
jgi:hypothetical protein